MKNEKITINPNKIKIPIQNIEHHLTIVNASVGIRPSKKDKQRRRCKQKAEARKEISNNE